MKPPLVAHVIHRLDVGGMENGLVNLINHMPVERYRHAIICMTDYTDFSQAIRRDDVTLHALHKREGKDLGVHRRLWRLLRDLRPDIVHTRNLATLEAQLTAALAGVRRRVHGEHGWDVGDLDGSRTRNQRLRRLCRPLVGRYIALSQHQLDYLAERIAVPADRIIHICNGVDTERFHPPSTGREALPLADFVSPGVRVIGAVMRMQEVKAPGILVDAFLALLDRLPEARDQLRLAIIGDGPLLPALRALVAAAGATELVWLPGTRNDVPELMRGMDLFVVPSLAEGISNTILEAMASGLPIIATDVGGNPDLVVPGETGRLIPAGDATVLADAIESALQDAERLQQQGRAARDRAVRGFSLDVMVQRYMAVYDEILDSKFSRQDAKAPRKEQQK